jgi:hypothetical protein
MIDHGFPLASQRERNGFGKTPDTATPKKKWPVYSIDRYVKKNGKGNNFFL